MPPLIVPAMVFAFMGALSVAVPAFAQVPSSSPPENAPIIVTAPSVLAPGEKASAWKRADGDDLTVYSNGSEDQLRRITENLERLHVLLTRLYLPRGHAETPARLEIVLFDSTAEMRGIGLSDFGSDEGPFAKPFVAQRYYDPRADVSILALARVDQIIQMNTSKAHDADCEDLAAAGADCVGENIVHPPMTRSWEAVLYGAYAQHLVLHYAAAVYPRWYIDGIGALFSTVVFKRDGSIEYGRPPEGYRAVLRSYGRLDTAGVLTGGYLRTPSPRMEWTPYHAWLLTHFFVLSNRKGAERTQFAQYMAAIAHGRSMAEAAQAFGTMSKLRLDVMGYAERSHEFATTAKAETEFVPPITPLSNPAAAALMARLAPSS